MEQAFSPHSLAASRAAARPGLQLLTVMLMAGLSWLLIRDWLAPLSFVVLGAVWYFLRAKEGPPVLALALTFQWAQVSSGVFYHGLTGRPLEAIAFSDYRPMVLIGLGCVVALLLGLRLALIGQHRSRPRLALPVHVLSTHGLLVVYFVLLSAMGFFLGIAWRFPLLTQGLVALSFLRLVALYLLLRRYSTPKIRWRPVLLLLGIEVVLGFTGFFASFREPLMMLVLVLLERFDARRLRHWFLVGTAVAAIFLSGLLWLSIRGTLRRAFEVESFAQSRTARLEKVASLSKGFFGSGVETMRENLDFFVSRLWAVYYPALAVARVPEVLPHENGRILTGAVRHILMPRLFFPNKPSLPSDSEMVRKYSGLWVAGADEGTSIAFGYAAESYIDFGLPWMFLPSLVFGFVMGHLYRFFLRVIWHRELAIGLVTVVFWLSLYLFERSWIKTLGFSFTLMIYMGVSVFVLDRFLMGRRTRRRRLLGLGEPLPAVPAAPPASPATSLP